MPGHLTLHFLRCSVMSLACGLKITAKHYDLLKIYSENTLRTDKNRFCRKLAYVNQMAEYGGLNAIESMVSMYSRF